MQEDKSRCLCSKNFVSRTCSPHVRRVFRAEGVCVYNAPFTGIYDWYVRERGNFLVILVIDDKSCGVSLTFLTLTNLARPLRGPVFAVNKSGNPDVKQTVAAESRYDQTSAMRLLSAAALCSWIRSTHRRAVCGWVPSVVLLHEKIFCAFHRLNMSFLAGVRQLLQTSAASNQMQVDVDTGPTSSLPDLTAVEAITMLCARNFTAVQYVTALDQRYASGGFSCNNPWITYNVTKVTNVTNYMSRDIWFSPPVLMSCYPSPSASHCTCNAADHFCRPCKMLLELTPKLQMALTLCPCVVYPWQ